MNKELYVSSTPHETKVALVEDDQLAEVYFERENEYTLAGSIYKGRVTRVLPGMQSAFVDIGLERDAFLYVSDFLDLQEEEDEEFGDVKVTGQQVAQANGFVLQNQPAEAVDEDEFENEAEESNGEESAETSAPAPTDEEGARRWRGRRRRRGRRGGRERIVPPAQQASEGEEAPAAESEPEDTGALEEAELAVSAEVAEVVEHSPVEHSAPPSDYAPILLPGESISKYNRKPGEPRPEAPVEHREERHDRGERGGRGERFGRGGRGDRGRDRGRGRDRDERHDRAPRERDDTPLPSNYQPIVLPGESLSKYRNIAPISTGDTSTVSNGGEAEMFDKPAGAPIVESTSTLPGISLGEPQLVKEPEQHESEPTEASASVRGPEWTAPFEAPSPSEEVEEVDEEEMVEETEYPSEPQPPAAQPEAPKPSAAEQERFERMNIASVFGGNAVEPVEEVAPSEPSASPAPEAALVEDHDDDAPTHQAGSYTLEGGYVEHEEIDEEEVDMPAITDHFNGYHLHDMEEEPLDPADDFASRLGAVAGLLGEAVRESDEERELDQSEYEYNGDEFEESEMVAGEEVEEEEEAEEAEIENGQAEPAAPGYERPASRPSFERRPRGRERDRDRGRGGRPGRGGMRVRREPRQIPMISDLLKEGQEILVQIAKEPINKKGARITSHIALPGRFLVYMPTVNHIGVSRKINSEEERQRLKRIVASERENGHGGFIVRTAAANIKEDELRADIRFLKHLWHEIRERAEKGKSPALIYHDLNLVERILRDQVTSDFSQIWVDNEQEYERTVRFASRFQPNLVRRIKLYTKDVPLFEQFGVQEEINKSLKSKVWLKSGGYIVINQTEALVAIDINTGKYVGKTQRLEDTIVKTNCDAVKEIVRQIRVRDLGGIIVIDFIDMDERRNRQKVMQTLEEALKADRAPSKVLQFNDFGLVAITRKRVKQSLERTLGSPCPYCTSTGFVKSVSTVCNEIYSEMRKVRRHIEAKDITLRVNPEVAKELKAGNGKWLQELEELISRPILVKSDALLHQEQFDINF